MEVKVSFTVSDGNAREAAEAVVKGLEELVEFGLVADYASDFTVTPVGVDGNGWFETERWRVDRG